MIYLAGVLLWVRYVLYYRVTGLWRVALAVRKRVVRHHQNTALQMRGNNVRAA